MAVMIKFGDIFRHNEKEYVFLAQVDDIIYAAEILNTENTKKVEWMYEQKVKNNSIEKVKNNVLYCFVILDTGSFKGRMAHFARTDGNNFDLTFDIIGTLEEKDLTAIKGEILAANSAVPIRLKDVVKSM